MSSQFRQYIQQMKSIKDKIFTIVKNRLYFLCSQTIPDIKREGLYFNIDDELYYEGINEDFGPLKLSLVYNFVKQLSEILQNPKKNRLPIYFHTGTKLKQYSNAILLVCAYQVLHLKYTPQKAYRLFEPYQIPAFRDISTKRCQFQCTILDCMKSLEIAVQLQWLSMSNFNLDIYDFFSDEANGNITQMIPNKIYVFKTPFKQDYDEYGNKQMTFNDYLTFLGEIGIRSIIEIIDKSIPTKCIQQGTKKEDINYHPIYLKTQKPTIALAQEFLKLIEKIDKNQKIAVLCSDGLGRSCTLIGCYAMKHYCLTAKQYIAWARLCRPGSVIGPQQFFLMSFEQQLRKEDLPSQSKIQRIKTEYEEQRTENHKVLKLRHKKSHPIFHRKYDHSPNYVK